MVRRTHSALSWVIASLVTVGIGTSVVAATAHPTPSPAPRVTNVAATTPAPSATAHDTTATAAPVTAPPVTAPPSTIVTRYGGDDGSGSYGGDDGSSSAWQPVTSPSGAGSPGSASPYPVSSDN